MPNAQIYCTIADLIEDLQLRGDDGELMNRIQSASEFINRKLGHNFIPISGSRTLDYTREEILNTQPILNITSVTVDGSAITDYTAYPRNRCWNHESGPYTWLFRESRWGLDEVVINGLWGVYLETKALGINATQLISASTLVATDGSLLSPGMVLAIDDEQELVTAGNGGPKSPAPTAATSLLNGAIDNAMETIVVDDGTEFHVGEVLQIDLEDFYILKKNGNNLICARGWNGTTQAAHVDDSSISVHRTFTVTRAVNGTTAAAHDAAAVSRYVPPADVNWLCRQIAGLMRLKAATQFSGKAGTNDLGEAFYVNEFPTRQIEAVQSNYAIPYL